MLAYAQQARVSNVEKAIQIALEAKNQAEASCYAEGVAKSYCQLGLYYMIIGQHELAAQYAENAHKSFENQQDQAGLAEALYVLGSINYKSAKHHVALEYLFSCLRIQERVIDKQGQSRTLKAIGYIYEAFDEYDKAEETYLRCRELSREVGDKDGESNACNPLSGIYLKKGDLTKANELIDASIVLKQQTGDKRGLAYSYYGKGKIYLHQADLENAELCFEKSLKKHLYVGDRMGAAMCYKKLGSLYFSLNKYDKSKEYFNQALAHGNAVDNYEIRYTAYYHLYLMAKNERDTIEALRYHELYHENKLNVINTGAKSHIKSLESEWKMESLEIEARNQSEKAKLTENKNEELSRFVSRVSHDLKGPLSSMIELHKIVESEIKDELALYYFGMYHKGLKRLNETILDLLELSVLKSKELEYSLINFEGLISECLDSFHYYPNFNDIDFQISIDLDIVVKSDKRLINTVVQNLLENSIKYSKTQSSDSFVKISVKVMAEDYYAIIVEDNGIGIDEAYQDKIFDMFYRANDEVQGSGLGLYILKTAIEKLDGDVNLYSRPNEGTKMIVILPL
ncbi:tetratricopeptide repeat-containing sensor histidine kinase [Reichenbachiella agarivorans]|uniref:histidine kinase n=1 Tax=Reichenbachiella agarivorans TaxID=2979464 RepID=A0ABY6CQ39_9BACT|nr:tetratricopeptide repeat-containing sensor histidine kinase [Reichenbachiella agarivorans]UXP31553.1 tetratricopeptide repeat-containing sensor histidine kinase [Reichenbachiella agarivorans]